MNQNALYSDQWREESSLLSSDGSSWIRTLTWHPDSGECPCGCVILVHGMAEHIERYDDFATYLAGQGFAVAGYDHVGHGKSVANARDLGHIPLSSGKEVLIEDVHLVRQALISRYPEYAYAPLFIFGHSMGSFVTRAYLARHAEGLAGAVLCGTGNPPYLLSRAGNLLCRLVAKVRGERCVSKLLYGLVEGKFAAFESETRTDLDWLSVDESVVDAYIEDPLSGQHFTAGGYAALTAVTADAANKEVAARVPATIPLLFVSGSNDPVGEAGKGVEAAVKLYKSAGVKEVDCILYPGMRHEILNEPAHLTVYQDVYAWLTAHDAPRPEEGEDGRRNAADQGECAHDEQQEGKGEGQGRSEGQE